MGTLSYSYGGNCGHLFLKRKTWGAGINNETFPPTVVDVHDDTA